MLDGTGDRVTWSYDAADRLTREQRSGASAYDTTFAYDLMGNRSVKNEDGALTTYTYDAANQLQTREDASGLTTYSFDPDGNQQIVEAPDAGRTTYTWNYDNQAILVELPSGLRVTTAYNGDNRRVCKDSTTRTYYLWDEANDTLLKETDEAGDTIAGYTHEPGPYGPLVSHRRSGQTAYYHYDGLGSTRALTDGSGNVTDAYTYSAYGEPLEESSATRTPLGYEGELGYFANSETSDIYVRARTYDPRTGRWLSCDPMQYDDEIINPYLYANDDPIGRTDPSGLKCPKGVIPKGFKDKVVRVQIDGKPVDISCPGLDPDAKPKATGCDPTVDIVKITDEKKEEACKKAKTAAENDVQVQKLMMEAKAQCGLKGLPLPPSACMCCKGACEAMAAAYVSAFHAIAICDCNDDATELSAFLVHELTHAIQNCNDRMGTKKCPDWLKLELEAYVAQGITDKADAIQHAFKSACLSTKCKGLSEKNIQALVKMLAKYFDTITGKKK